MTRSGVALVSEARTVETGSEPLGGGGHLVINVDVTLDAASASITPTVQGWDIASGKWDTIWTAAAALTATGQVNYQLGPGLLASVGGGYTDTENVVIPDTWRFLMLVNDADAITYSLGWSIS